MQACRNERDESTCRCPDLRAMVWTHIFRVNNLFSMETKLRGTRFSTKHASPRAVKAPRNDDPRPAPDRSERGSRGRLHKRNRGRFDRKAVRYRVVRARPVRT